MALFQREMRTWVELVENNFVTRATLVDFTHEMEVNLVVNSTSLEILDISAKMIRVPYDLCYGALKDIPLLKGLVIHSGISRRVRQILGGTKGCVHMVDLIGTAFKGTIQGNIRQQIVGLDEIAKRKKLTGMLQGTCIRYRPDSTPALQPLQYCKGCKES